MPSEHEIDPVSAYVGLGGNLGDACSNITQAIELLDFHLKIRVSRRSSFYQTAPWGNEDQADFTNAVVELETTLTPHELLNVLLETERLGGRRRGGEQWGPRSIDLDLLLYGQAIINESDLVLPHPRMQMRAFVLKPLLELKADAQIPGVGPAADCLAELEDQRVVKII